MSNSGQAQSEKGRWWPNWDQIVRNIVRGQLEEFSQQLKEFAIISVKVDSPKDEKVEREKRKYPLIENKNKRFQVPVVVLVELIAHAIAHFEGFYLQKSESSVAQRFNNPGNLRSWEKVPLEEAKDGGSYAFFPTAQEGWRALRLQVWKNVVGRRMTLIEFFERYAPSSDNNRPFQYAEFVQKYLRDRGVDLLLNIGITDQGISDNRQLNYMNYPVLSDV